MVFGLMLFMVVVYGRVFFFFRFFHCGVWKLRVCAPSWGLDGGDGEGCQIGLRLSAQLGQYDVRVYN